MLTQQQTQGYIRWAKARGLSDGQIKMELDKYNMQQPTANQTPQASMPQQPAPQQPAPQQPVVQQPTAQPERGSFVKEFFKGLVNPAIRYGTFVGEAAGQLGRSAVQGITGERRRLMEKTQAGTATEEEMKRLLELNEPIFMKQENFDKLSTPKGIALETLKSTAGGASYFIPGGVAGKAVSPLLRAGIGSGLATLSASEKEELDQLAVDFGVGATTGALFQGAFNLVGRGVGKAANPILSKVTRKLSGAADDLSLGVYSKAMGIKPTSRFGGKELLNKMRLMGFKPGDANEVISQADEVLAKNSKVVSALAEEMSGKGQKINIGGWIKGLEREAKSAKLPSDRKIKQTVVDEIKEAVGDGVDVDPLDFYLLKQSLGTKGRWNSNADADTLLKAEMFRDAYIGANDLFDTALKEQGFSQFRGVNEALHTAMRAKSWAEHADNVAPNVNSIGLIDTITALAGGGIAGIPGAIAAVGARKALNSGVARETAARSIRTGLKLAKAQKTAQTAGKLGDIVVNALSQATREELEQPADGAETAISEEPVTTDAVGTPTTTEPTPTTEASAIFGGRSKQELLQLAASQGADLKDLKEIADTYDLLTDGGKSQTDYTEVEQATLDASYLIDQAVEMLNSGKIKTGALAGPLEGVKAKVGAADQDTLDFNVTINNLKATIAKARAGTSFTPNEQKMLDSYAPNVGDSKQEIETKLKNLKALFDKKRANLGVSGS